MRPLCNIAIHRGVKPALQIKPCKTHFLLRKKTTKQASFRMMARQNETPSTDESIFYCMSYQWVFSVIHSITSCYTIEDVRFQQDNHRWQVASQTIYHSYQEQFRICVQQVQECSPPQIYIYWRTILLNFALSLIQVQLNFNRLIVAQTLTTNKFSNYGTVIYMPKNQVAQ